MRGEVDYLKKGKSRLVISFTWQVLYLITSSAISQKGSNYCILEFPTRRGKSDYVPRKYINMIQAHIRLRYPPESQIN